MPSVRFTPAATLLAAALAAAAAAQPPLPLDLGALDPIVRERIESLSRAVGERPDDAGGWLDLGKAYHAHELTEPAEACYREAIRLRPADGKAWYFLAHAQADLGEVDQALRGLEEVIRLAPEYAPAHWRRGRWLHETGRLDEAESAFRRSVEVDPAAAAGWIGLARLRIERGSPQAAIAPLERVLAADPANGVAGQLLGTALRATGREEAARRILGLATGAGAWFPDPWREEIAAAAAGIGHHLRRLTARLERGEIDGALGELEALREEHPDDVGVLNKLAEAHLLRGDAEAALEALRPALTADPEEFSTLIHLAEAERLRGDPSEAMRWAERAERANPRLWHAPFLKAGLLHRAGRFAECAAEVDAAMRLGAHQNPNAWLMRGDAQLQLAAWESAAETFEQASRRFPYLGQALVGLALARVELGEPAAAREALQRALRLQPEDATTRAVAERIAALEAADGG